jgi:ABC-type multidrug transport system fused ATPase/permease subunit
MFLYRQFIFLRKQDPILFSTSIRINLDPFKNHTDEELWHVLELVNFKSFFENSKAKLDFELTEGGENLR